ncbi:type II toxin-antitoxin system HicA family toxin [Kineosporia babensis]|uniref:type II toxin-antitoxin system HicA family toxin n=1 Tax=Kineosporia babensis TaxID=499548 RepID=UPI0038B2DB9F
MKRRAVERALRAIGCAVLREGGKHTVWVCSCGGSHQTAVPRHREISPGVVDNIRADIACGSKGWLR